MLATLIISEIHVNGENEHALVDSFNAMLEHGNSHRR